MSARRGARGHAYELVLTVEHAGRRVPAAYAKLFDTPEARAALDSHRGWDPGAWTAARALGRATGVRPRAHAVTRLLVDVNRSLHHPTCFSEFSRHLPPDTRDRIAREHHLPHRAAVGRDVERAVASCGRCVHVGVHTFAPILDGVTRRADLGILYDPRRCGERALGRAWAVALRAAVPGLGVRRNYPYRGRADGLTMTLRARFADDAYQGVELELNQALFDMRSGRTAVRRIVAALAGQLADR